MKPVQSFLFSAGIVIFFFTMLEVGIRLSGFESAIQYGSYSIPAWMEEMDPVILERYKKFVAGQGFVNEDAYAYERDLRYGFKLKSNLNLAVRNYSSALMVDKLPVWKIYSDSEGFRTSSIGKTSSKQIKRTLFVMGDSSSFGWGVDFEKSYPSLLIERLNKAGQQFSLKNLSIPGFSSFQGRLLLQELDDVKEGDWVVLSYGWNDSYPSLQTDLQHYQSRNTWWRKMSWILRHIKLYSWLRSRLNTFYPPLSMDKKILESRVSIEDYRKNLESSVFDIKAKGAKPILVSVCNISKYRNQMREVAVSQSVKFLNFPAMFEPYLSTVHDRFPDLFVTYFEAYGKNMEDNPMLAFLFPDRCHPNEIGHDLMAQALFKTLRNKFFKDFGP